MSREQDCVTSLQSGPLYLSTLLEEGRIAEVQTRSKVALYGLDVQSNSGYITVNKKHDSNLFFWFFPSTKVPQDKAPLLVYLNGGPGNSSLIGLFEEVGPLKVDEKGVVGKRTITWTDKFSVVFVDSPVGTGFSYCSPGGEVTTNKVVADDLYSFLVQFLQLFPEYQKCDVYLGGISYAGKYVPEFAYMVHNEMRQAKPTVVINLKGIFIGSGLCNPGKMLPHYPELLLSLGMITKKKGTEFCMKLANAMGKFERQETTKEIIECVFTDMQNLLGFIEMDNAQIAKSYNWKFADFLNKHENQIAIHVHPIFYKAMKGSILMDMAEDFLDGIDEKLSLLMDNYKVLIYNGQFDLLVSSPMTEVFLQDLQWSGRDEYLAGEKKKWVINDDVAGYVTKVNNFTRVVIRNAGHRAAIDQPAWVMDMMDRFIHNRSFSTCLDDGHS